MISLAAFGAAQAQDKGPLSPMDVAMMKMVVSCEISPDGSTIAYGLLDPADPVKDNSRAEVHLYTCNVASGASTPFVTTISVSSVKFRPGHASITFLAKREGDDGTSVYEIPLSGGEAQKLFTHSSSISAYEWHSGGNKLVFVAKVPKEEPAPELPYQPEVYEENLSLNGAWIGDVNGGDPIRINTQKHVYDVTWNPAGTRIAFSAAPTPLVDDRYTSNRIYIAAADGTVSGEVDHKAKLGDFHWSPDGSRIAFIGGEDKHDPIDGRLMIVDGKGGKPSILHSDFRGKFEQIKWKDNGTLYFLASEGVKTSFGTTTLEGKMVKSIDKGDLAITHFSMANNRAVSLAAESNSHPRELYYMKSMSGKPQRKTVSNPWMKDRQLATQEVVTWKAADGLEIEGLLIHPLNRAEGRKYPLITVVHGGPEAHYDNGWLTYYSMPGQVGAGMGFAVFYPNYRGSTGRGIEYLKSSQADPGGKEFDDIIAGIDHLAGLGWIDKNKVGVTGGSYGGYATGWMATRHTERFAAGVMFVGISNNLSKWGTSDIPEEMFLVHSRKRIWDDYDFFLKRSPIYYAGQSKTPLLIMAGKDDTRVDPGQSYELYRHIKTRTETPVRLVLYPGEGHGNRKATARLDYSLRQLRWFNNYLKDSPGGMPETVVSEKAAINKP